MRWLHELDLGLVYLNGSLKALVESSWILMGKDPAIRWKYGNIKHRRGGKRAIVAVARTA